VISLFDFAVWFLSFVPRRSRSSLQRFALCFGFKLTALDECIEQLQQGRVDAKRYPPLSCPNL
jgi:hypothetical protein